MGIFCLRPVGAAATAARTSVGKQGERFNAQYYGLRCGAAPNGDGRASPWTKTCEVRVAAGGGELAQDLVHGVAGCDTLLPANVGESKYPLPGEHQRWEVRDTGGLSAGGRGRV